MNKLVINKFYSFCTIIFMIVMIFCVADLPHISSVLQSLFFI